MKIRPLFLTDWETVSHIYKEGMETGIATFETQVPDWKTWNAKFLSECRLVAEENNKVLGWAVLSPTSKRSVYKGVAEVTIYVDQKCTHQGIGSVLLKALIEESEQKGFWTLQSIIFVKNKGSIRLHEKLGFRVVGIRERIAQRNGTWYDTVLMERRSIVNG